MIQTSINNPIHNQKFQLILHTEKDFDELAKLIGEVYHIEIDPNPPGRVINDDKERDSIVMTIDTSIATLGVVCHESVHVAQKMLYNIGEDDSILITETLAYLIEFIFREVCKVLTANNINLSLYDLAE